MTVSEETSQPVVFDNVIVVIFVVEGSCGGRHTLGEVVVAAVQDTTATTHTPVSRLVIYTNGWNLVLTLPKY